MKQFNSREKQSKYYTKLYIDEVIKKYNSKFQIRYKHESKLFKWLKPILLLINKNFFTDYITVIFGTMWVPDDFFEQDYKTALRTVAHEGIHEYDRSRLPKGFFEIMYLFPQILFIPFLLLSIFYSWWFLIPTIVFLCPLPAPGRFWIEMRGYDTEKIWAENVFKTRLLYPQAFIVYEISSIGTYYATWPFKKSIRRRFQKPISKKEQPYKDVFDFLKRHDLIEKD